MAFREVTLLELKEVLRLARASVPKKRIAARLGIDVKTVRGYLRALERSELAPDADLDDQIAAVSERLEGGRSRSRGAGWALCEAERAFIKGKLDARVRLTKVRKLLLRLRGVKVSYATLYRFSVEELGFGRHAATIPVADCGPGEEIQLDTGWVGWLEDLFGKRRRFRTWIFTSVLLRHRFAYPVFRETTETAIEACEAAWAHFGGVFKVLIPDNTKTIVNRADPLSPKLNQTFLEYAQSRGFHIDPTRVRSPRDKARVERSVQTVRDDCFGGETLRSLEEARDHARRWSLEEYGMRRHSTTRRMPLEHFESEEKPVLLVAPTEPDLPLRCEPKVARDLHAAVAKSLYSLPPRYRGRTLMAVADRHTVRFYDGRTLVKTHPRVPPGQRSTDPNDFPPDKLAYARRDVAYLKKRAAEHGEWVGRFAEILLEGRSRGPGCGRSTRCWAWRVATDPTGWTRRAPSRSRPT